MRLESSSIVQPSVGVSTSVKTVKLAHTLPLAPLRMADRFGNVTTEKIDQNSVSLGFIMQTNNGLPVISDTGVVLGPGHKGNGSTKVRMEKGSGDTIKILWHGTEVGSLSGTPKDPKKPAPVLIETKQGSPRIVLPVLNNRGQFTAFVLGSRNSKITANGVTATLDANNSLTSLNAPPEVKASVQTQATFSKDHVLQGPLKKATVLGLAGGDGSRAWMPMHKLIDACKATLPMYIEQDKKGNYHGVSPLDEILRAVRIAGFENHVLINTREENVKAMQPLLAKARVKNPEWLSHVITGEEVSVTQTKPLNPTLVPERISGGQGSLMYWAAKDKLGSYPGFKNNPVVLMATDAHIQVPWGKVEKAYEALAKKHPNEPFVLSLYQEIPNEKVQDTYGSASYTGETVDVEGSKLQLKRVNEFIEKPSSAQLNKVSYSNAQGETVAGRRLLIEIYNEKAIDLVIKKMAANNIVRFKTINQTPPDDKFLLEAAIQKQQALAAQQLKESEASGDKVKIENAKALVAEWKEPFDHSQPAVLGDLVEKKQVAVYAFPIDEPWFDTGTLHKLRQFQQAIATGVLQQDGYTYPEGKTAGFTAKPVATILDKNKPYHMVFQGNPATCWPDLEKQGINTFGEVAYVGAKAESEGLLNKLKFW